MNMPLLGFGTFRLQDDVAYQSTLSALKLGYRHIDTAQIYGNEAQVGQAIKDSKISPDELFITTKVWNDNLSQALLIKSVKESLHKLQLERVDLLLVHWPAAPEGVTMQEYLSGMIDAKHSGLCTQLGVSNFTTEHLAQAAQLIGYENIATNQVEVHPYLQNKTLRAFCDAHNLHITAYMPFAYGKVLKDPIIEQIAQVHKCSTAEVALAWLRQNNMAAIPSSTQAKNMQANLNSNRVELSAEDIASINTLERNDRQATPDFSPVWDA